jgi:hypothetical protein
MLLIRMRLGVELDHLAAATAPRPGALTNYFNAKSMSRLDGHLAGGSSEICLANIVRIYPDLRGKKEGSRGRANLFHNSLDQFSVL